MHMVYIKSLYVVTLLYVVTVYRESTRALKFQNICQVRFVGLGAYIRLHGASILLLLF
jgi:hypothetical protein